MTIEQNDTAITSAPVVKHRTWRHLLRELSSNPSWRFIGTMTEREASVALGAPVAIARWIATQAPSLLDRPSLRIVVAGTEIIDVVDDGMWYASLPALLGRPEMTVDISLVGREPGTVWGDICTEIGVAPIRTRCAGLVPNTTHSYTMSLSEFLARHDGSPDVVAFFNPGFNSEHENWFANDVFHRLISQGMTVFGTSVDNDVYVIDRLGMEGYGFTGIGDPMENPFAVATENDMGHFAKCLWRFPTGKSPLPTDYWAYERMETLSMILDESDQQGHTNEIQRLGVMHEIKTGFGQDAIISLPFGHWLSTTTGTLYLGNENGLMPWLGHVVEPADIRAYPGPAASLYQRAIWAADITMKYAIWPETHEIAQEWFDIEDMARGNGAVFTDIEKIFSDSTHLQPALEMMLGCGSRKGDSNHEEARQLATMFAPEPKRKVAPSAKPLFAALEKSDFAAASEILKTHHELVHAEDEEGQTPLYVAVTMDEPDFVVFCHQLGGDPNHRDREGWPVIMEASRRRARRCLGTLMHLHGLDINGQNKLGWNALLLALSRMDFETAELLVDGGADLDVVGPVGITARQMISGISETPPSLRAKCLHPAGQC